MQYFKMTQAQYSEYIKKKSPNSKTFSDICKAFLTGGIICTIGQALSNLYIYLDLAKETSASLTSITLIFIAALLTALGVYDDLAKFGGAGTLVPITGFSNSMTSAALEFKSEGFIAGVGAKMFIIAGPVIVFGISTSIIYGLVMTIF